MSKSDLKAAMDALQVNKPFKLNRSPTFKAPPPPPAVAVPREIEEIQEVIDKATTETQGTQKTEGSLNSKATLEPKVSQESISTQEFEVTSKPQVSQNFKPTEESKASQSSGVTQNSKVTQEVRVTSETEVPGPSRPTQNFRVPPETQATQEFEVTSKPVVSAPNLKPTKREVLIRNEKGEIICVNKKDLPAVELVSHLTLTTEGYGSLSNRILEILYRADFDKAEHEILEFIIRESIFWRQEWTDPMSGAAFEKLSGITSASLWTHLKRLTDKGWLERELIKVSGKGQACNRYRLNPNVWGSLLPKKRKDTQETEGTQNSGDAQDSEDGRTQESKGTSYSGNQSTASLYEKKSLKTDLKTSLSQVPEALQNRWSKMVDQGKSERETFFNLLQAYGRPVWDHCADVVEYLKSNGDLRKRPVGSPFGLLAQGENWEVFLGLTLAKKSKELAIKAARETVPLSAASTPVDPNTELNEPKTPPPAEFLNFFKQKRGPSSAMRVFEGQFVDMEAAFQKRFISKVEQWTEIQSQLGPIADSIEHEKAKWITGIQRWFKGAWDRGEIAI